MCLLLMNLSGILSAQEVIDSTQEDINSLRQKIETLKMQRLQDSLNVENRFRQERLWKKSRPLIIGIGNQTMMDKTNGVKYKKSLSIGVSFRRTYYLHDKAIANMMKFGLDVSFFDLTYTRYAKGKGSSLENVLGNVTEETFEDNADGMGNDILNSINIGKHSVTLGVAVGPSLKIAPFYQLNKKALDKLKVTLYGHYVPSFCGIAMMGDGNKSFSGGYMGLWRYGINLSFSRIGIGIEHYKGKGKLHNFSSDDVDDDEDDGEAFLNFTKDKAKYTLSGTRLYIGFLF